MQLGEGKKFPSAGVCIYCGSKEQLSKEHIIPYSLGGNLVLPHSSCRNCADVTKKFEQTCARGIFGGVRIRLNMPTRNPDERPKVLSTVIVREGVSEEIQIPSMEYPATCIGLKLPTPGIPSGKEPTSVFERVEWVAKTIGQDYEKYITKPGDAIRLGAINPHAFCKLLAKIAHSYVVAQIGVNAFTHYLPEIILGHSDKHAYLIGGDIEYSDSPDQDSSTSLLHQLNLRKMQGTNLLYVSVQLFCFMNMPRYHVVVGEDLRETHA